MEDTNIVKSINPIETATEIQFITISLVSFEMQEKTRNIVIEKRKLCVIIWATSKDKNLDNDTWEDTVNRILYANKENVLLGEENIFSVKRILKLNNTKYENLTLDLERNVIKEVDVESKVDSSIVNVLRNQFKILVTKEQFYELLSDYEPLEFETQTKIIKSFLNTEGF